MIVGEPSPVTVSRPQFKPCAMRNSSIKLSSNFKTFMKARSLKKDKVNIITLGCSKNMVDSEVLSGQLVANDIDVVHENTKRDHNIVIVNTCGFIDKAKEE